MSQDRLSVSEVQEEYGADERHKPTTRYETRTTHAVDFSVEDALLCFQALLNNATLPAERDANKQTEVCATLFISTILFRSCDIHSIR